jgi:hypothetical protein
MVQSRRKYQIGEGCAMGKVQLLVCSLVMSLLVGLGGCGGGGAAPEASVAGVEPPTDLAPLSAASTLLPTSASASVDAAPVQGVNASAIHWLGERLGSDNASNLAVVMPLSQAFLWNLSRAAQGETLSGFQAGIVAGSLEDVMQASMAPVDRQVWGMTGTLFKRAFLSSVQHAGPQTPLNSLSTAEADFSQLWEEPAFNAAIASAGLTTQWDKMTGSYLAKLVTIDQFSAAISMPGGVLRDVAYASTHSASSRKVRPAMVWSDQVKQLAGEGYELAYLKAASHTVMTITPTNAALGNWSSAQWRAAVEASLRSVAAGEGVAGELVLLNDGYALNVDMARLVSPDWLGFSTVNADMRGLDLVGGTHVELVGSQAALSVGVSGITLTAATGVVHKYSPQNVNQFSDVYFTIGEVSPVSAVVFTSYFGSGGIPSQPECPSDMRKASPSFLVVLDANAQVLFMAAMSSPDHEVGEECIIR